VQVVEHRTLAPEARRAGGRDEYDTGMTVTAAGHVRGTGDGGTFRGTDLSPVTISVAEVLTGSNRTIVARWGTS